MRWVDRWQNQGRQGCGIPMGVSALLLVPSIGSITSWGAQGGPKSTADYGTGSASLPCKRIEPQHATSCLTPHTCPVLPGAPNPHYIQAPWAVFSVPSRAR